MANCGAPEGLAGSSPQQVGGLRPREIMKERPVGRGEFVGLLVALTGVLFLGVGIGYGLGTGAAYQAYPTWGYGTVGGLLVQFAGITVFWVGLRIFFRPIPGQRQLASEGDRTGGGP